MVIHTHCALPRRERACLTRLGTKLLHFTLLVLYLPYSKFLEVILDLVSGPSARLRRDRASTPRDLRWDKIISHPRHPRFYSRSWVEIRSVRRNYFSTYGYGTYIDICTVILPRTYIYIHTSMYVPHLKLFTNKGVEIEMTARVEISRISSRGARSRIASTNFGPVVCRHVR
jgi:hypothetical protein